MKRSVILLTGTPGVGKTTIARKLSIELDAHYINLTDFALKHKLIAERDMHRKTLIIDEKKMRKKIKSFIQASQKKKIIIEGHYAAAVVPKGLATRVFVLRRNPVELRTLMQKRNFKNSKLWENLASEILDVSLIEALREHTEAKVCELDITGKAAESVSREIAEILAENKECKVGCVDWLKTLEEKGVVEEYLRV